MCRSAARGELWLEVGYGGRREGGISWGCLTPPLPHRKSGMPCPTIPSSRRFSPGAFDDQLTEILRNGARAPLAKAVEAKVADFLRHHADLKTEDGRRRVERHGTCPSAR
jgi:hypothetical protein